jgi:hypothetical protein
LAADVIDEGIKTITSDALANIRQGGSSVSFDFNNKSALGNNSPNYLPNTEKKQVGVIRPIARTVNEEEKLNRLNSELRTTNTQQLEAEKEVLLINKEQMAPLPKTYLKLQAQAATINRDVPDVAADKGKDEAVLVMAKPAVITEDTDSDAERKPSPKLEEKKPKVEEKKPRVEEKKQPKGETAPKVKVVKNIELEQKPLPPKRVISFGEEKVISFGEEKENEVKKSNGHMVVDDGLNVDDSPNSSPPSAVNNKITGGGSYRDTWKKRNDEQNTVVFNFANTKKDVTHIENDGRDISRRPKSSKSGSKKRRKEAQKSKVSEAILIVQCIWLQRKAI